MPTPASLATAAMGADGSRRNTVRAASRISASLQVAWAFRPGSAAVAAVMSAILGVVRNGSFRYCRTERSIPFVQEKT